jgi:hypothetical protein
VKRVVTVALVIVALAAIAQAQSSRPASFYVGAGISPISGDYGKAWKMGFHGSLGVGITTAPGLQIVPKVEYHAFPLDKQGYPVSGGTLSTMMFGGDVRYQLGLPEASARPMILGGIGMARASVSTLSGGGESITFGSETKVYFEFGGGVVFKAGPSTKVFVTVRYTSVALTGQSFNYIPITLGLVF